MAEIKFRTTTEILNDVQNMKLEAVEKAIQEEFPKLILSAIRVHSHYLRKEPDSKKQKIAEKILKLSADDKFWTALKSIKLVDKPKKEEKNPVVKWAKGEQEKKK